MSKKFRLRIGHRLASLKIQIWISRVWDHVGITNETPDGMYVPFWDFKEGTSLENIRSSLYEIQLRYRLSDIYIIQTYPKESFRAFCFDKINFLQAIQILASTSHIDVNYLRSLAMRKLNVIRITQKKGTTNKIVSKLSSWNDTREKSTHHILFFHKVYGELIPKPDIQKIQVRLSKYETFR